MSLFGGDSAPVSDDQSSEPEPPLDDDSDFSIEEVGPPPAPPRPVHVQFRNREHVSSLSQSSHSDGSHQPLSQSDNNNNNRDDYDYYDKDDDDDDDDASISSNEKRRREWLGYTMEERRIAEDVHVSCSDDLSIHLFNTHVLKARLRQTERAANVKSTRPKSKWIPRDENTGKQPWYPNDKWAAWPVPQDRVPAGDRLFDAPMPNEDLLDAFTVKNPRVGKDKVSKGLEEQLSAVFLVRARTMWQQRPNHTVTEPESSSSQPLSRMEFRSMSRDKSRSRSVSRPPDIPDDHDPQPHPPVFSADEDRSHKLLAPAVRHVIADLDKLLLALHHQRDGQEFDTADEDSDEDSEKASDEESDSDETSDEDSDEESDEESDDESTRSISKASILTSMKHQDQDTIMLDTNAVPSGSKYKDNDNDNAPRDSKHRRPSPTDSAEEDKRELGLRDWSQVLGMAAMTGWNPAIVERARKRCAALFGEDMIFRTLPEHGPVHTGLSSDAEEREHKANARPVQLATGYVCPRLLCQRHTEPYAKARHWREHLRRHGESNDQIADLERQMELSGQVSKIARQNALDHNPMDWVPPDPLGCPHCEKSPMFARVSRLLDHLKRVHRYDPRIRRAPLTTESSKKKGKQPAYATAADSDTDSQSDSTKSSSSDDEEDTEDEGVSGDDMFGGVHVDGFLRPCIAPRGKGKDQKKRLENKASKMTTLKPIVTKRKRELLTDDEDDNEDDEASDGE